MGVRNLKKVMLLIAAVWLLAGCGHSMLTQVERLMETDLEAADSLISSIEEPAGKRSRALYALLKTQIDYKMYRDATNDSTIRVATTYFGRRYKGYHAAMAWYSLGCVAAELGQDSTAADAYLTAIRLFPDTLVRYYALAEQNLSCIYLDHKMDVEAIPMIKACYNNATRLGDSIAMAFCEFNIARFLLYKNELDSAKVLFLDLKDNNWMSPDTKDEPYLQLSKIAIFKDSDYIGALNYVDSFMVSNKHKVPYGQAYSVKADAYYYLEQLDSAYRYYKLSLTESDDPYSICDAYRRISEINSINGNKDSASFFAKQASSWMDTIASSVGSYDFYNILLNNQNSFPAPINRRNTLLLIAVLSVSTVVLVLFVLLSKTRQKELSKQQKNIEPKAETISDFD